ncbi:MAG: sodium:calcium antiporter [Betaproteobacteria bacterium]|jgi:cation:H+ antiporter|nr:MAG: sodium:calcium antiporter [Betaproteobacteria bacterium]
MLLIWLEFAVCVTVITIAGYKLSIYGSVIAERTGMGGTLVGLILLAAVTSLPELITGISAVTIANVPDIAIGSLMGSCVFNLALLVILDFLYREESVYSKAHQGHVLSAGFGVVVIGFTGFSVLESTVGILPPLSHVGIYTPIIFVSYLLATRTVFRYERDHRAEFVEEATEKMPGITVRDATVRYSVAAIFVIVAGAFLPVIGDQMAIEMGWQHSFVGTLLIAIATSAPEVVVTITALRLGALNMAIGNLLGSNLFNIAIVPVVDLLYTKGPILSNVSVVHAVSAMSATIMTGIFVVGLFYRSRTRLYRTIGWASLMLLSVYLINSYILFIHGG